MPFFALEVGSLGFTKKPIEWGIKILPKSITIWEKLKSLQMKLHKYTLFSSKKLIFDFTCGCVGYADSLE